MNHRYVAPTMLRNYSSDEERVPLAATVTPSNSPPLAVELTAWDRFVISVKECCCCVSERERDPPRPLLGG